MKRLILILLIVLPQLRADEDIVKFETFPASDVVVEVIDKILPKGSEKQHSFLWENFFNKPEEEKFSDYTLKGWKRNFQAFAGELVKKSDQLGLDSNSLNRAVYLALANAKGEIAYLPVAAYQTTYRNRNVWIILMKWEYTSENPEHQFGLGHLRAYVYDQETLGMVAFTTCD